MVFLEFIVALLLCIGVLYGVAHLWIYLRVKLQDWGWLND